jgi:hypothetical protein
MQKTKIAAEELAEMIRDGLAEEGHEVHGSPVEAAWQQPMNFVTLPDLSRLAAVQKTLGRERFQRA